MVVFWESSNWFCCDSIVDMLKMPNITNKSVMGKSNSPLHFIFLYFCHSYHYIFCSFWSCSYGFVIALKDFNLNNKLISSMSTLKEIHFVNIIQFCYFNLHFQFCQFSIIVIHFKYISFSICWQSQVLLRCTK